MLAGRITSILWAELRSTRAPNATLGYYTGVVSTLVCWVGVDTHGISSVYIATDSRISLAGQVGGPK